MENDGFNLYRYWLSLDKETGAEEEKAAVQDTFTTTIQESAAYQRDALRNGRSQPIVAIRADTKKCKITVIPGDEMYIGDLIYVFNEYWLCMELYTDEYGLTYGEAWMCNQVFKYQNHALNCISKYAIIDDGSYSKGSDKAIPVTDNSFTCYMSLDEESAALYVDKRLAFDVVLDSKGEEILEVGKIVWIDTKSKNFGKGSHLLAFGTKDDVYNKESDNLPLLICDYKEADASNEVVAASGYLSIVGRNSLRIGTSRTYSVVAVEENGKTVDPTNVQWSIDAASGISIEPNGNKCVIQVPLEEDLVGGIIKIGCVDSSGNYQAGNIEVAVISIG